METSDNTKRAIDPTYLLSRVEMLEGQARFLRQMLAAVIAASPNPTLVAEHMSLMWQDLREELLPNPQDSADQKASRHNALNGAQTAWNTLNDGLRRPPRPST